MKTHTHLFVLWLLSCTCIYAQDQHIQGSLEIGVDANPSTIFGFDTFIMSENNLRMLFKDTSTGIFSGNDWRFTFNSTASGGASYFSIDDVTAATVPFRIDAGAINNALRIKSNGNVGIGTSNPSVKLELSSGDSPRFRLNQTTAGGFSPYQWDIAGNEANFFFSDITAGNSLFFRVQPGTPQNTLTLRASGTVGIGTWTPNNKASLHLSKTTQGFMPNRLTTAERTTFGNSLGAGDNGMIVFDSENNRLYFWNGAQWETFGTNTDEQELSLATNTLSITGGTNTVDLSGYLDNTDAQDLELTSNTLSLTNDGTTVDLSGYLDNTDAQDLELTGNTLSITGGTNTIDLSGYVNTDSQNLTSATLTGSTLTVAIENGTSVDVDLAPILSSLVTENRSQQTQIDDLIARMETLEGCACSSPTSALKSNEPILYQNIPNPFNGTTSIKYYIPKNNNSGAIVFNNISGQIIDTITLKQFGEQELFFNSSSLSVGIYFYTLYVDGHKIETKKMIVE